MASQPGTVCKHERDAQPWYVFRIEQLKCRDNKQQERDQQKSLKRVIPYQFTEVLHITLSSLDETWYVGSPGGLM